MRSIFISLMGGNRHVLTVGNSASSAPVFRNPEGTPTLTDKREVPDAVAHSCHFSTREVETGESGVQGRLSLPRQ